MLDDLRFAIRMFARRRRFAALLVVTVALGIGAATSIFSLVDTVLWKPLPYRDADRLYWVARTDASWRESPVLAAHWNNLSHALPDYHQWARAQRSFEATGAWFTTNGVLEADEGIEQIATGRATASLLPLLGVRPALGRWFFPGEDVRDGRSLGVLSFEAWQRRFAGDSTILGRRLTLNGQPTEIVGVLPRSFRIAGDTNLVEIWTPAGVASGDWQRRSMNFRVVGRLRTATSLTDATDEAARLLATSDTPGRTGIRLEHLQTETIRNVRAPLTVLLAAATLLLVIACGNVATMLVGDAAWREAEIATRVSLGATPGRVARQLLTENVALAMAGGVLGSIAALGLVRVLRAYAPPGIPRIELAQVDGRVVAFAIAVTIVTAIACSLAPLVTVLGASPASAMHAGSTRLTRQRGGLERAGVFVQSALVVILLAAAALLVRTHGALTAVDPGFRAGSLLAVRLRFLPPVTRYRDPESRRAVLHEIAARLDALPGVDAATPAFAIPFQGVSSTSIHIGGSGVVPPTEEVAGTYIVAAPGFFETMGIALRAGRLFEAVDDAPGSAVIISETMAHRFWPNANAIGRQILVDEIWRDVVGVVADVRHRTVDEAPRATFYLPAAQAGQRIMDAVVLRTASDPRALMSTVRRTVARVDPSLAIARADRLSDLVDATLVAERFRMMLLVVFSIAAVALTAVGIIGVATNAVLRRTRELAIRMAVGAAPAAAVRLVMSATFVAVVGGAATGVAVALAVTRSLRPFLFGISSADPLTYVAVSSLLLILAGLATWIPAQRSARIDLMRTLSGG